MSTDAAIGSELQPIIDAALRGQLTEPMALRAIAMGPEAASAVMMAASRKIAQLRPHAPGPHSPSGAVPAHTKPPVSKRRRGQPGARPGHTGHRRPAPAVIDHHVQLPPLSVCPECRGPVLPARRSRKRIVEDLPQDTRVQATEYTIPSHWCPACGKHVEPAVAAALPGATIGNSLLALTTVFHYGLGLTIDQTREVLLSPLRMTLSAGGLVDLWRRTAQVLLPWYQRIGRDARASATLHADETGWRVDGDTHWLWCFCNHTNCYYLIDEGRGGPTLLKFFTEAFAGVLIHDFWPAYMGVRLEEGGEHQCCLAHLLRELDQVDRDVRPHKPPERAREWDGFAKMLRRLVWDGIRLRRREGFTPQKYASRIRCIDQRLTALGGGALDAGPDAYADPDAHRLAKRLRRHRDELFTFLDRPEAAWENNFAERQIRPAVILRKNSQCNRSDRGAGTQAVLMSVYRTLKLRGHDPRRTIAQALTAYAASGQLPDLPSAAVAGG